MKTNPLVEAWFEWEQTISSLILFFSFRHEVCTSIGELKGGLESTHKLSSA
jgi:hypothetical protein